MATSQATMLYIHNTPGAAAIRIGAPKFMCIGALPPFDHPHVFLNMGDEKSTVCPYCSTYFFLDIQLKADECIPSDCLWVNNSPSY